MLMLTGEDREQIARETAVEVALRSRAPSARGDAPRSPGIDRADYRRLEELLTQRFLSYARM